MSDNTFGGKIFKLTEHVLCISLVKFAGLVSDALVSKSTRIHVALPLPPPPPTCQCSSVLVWKIIETKFFEKFAAAVCVHRFDNDRADWRNIFALRWPRQERILPHRRRIYVKLKFPVEWHFCERNSFVVSLFSRTHRLFYLDNGRRRQDCASRTAKKKIVPILFFFQYYTPYHLYPTEYVETSKQLILQNVISR